MQEVNLFLTFLAPLRTLGVRYMVTGSVASMLYGEPRLTHDVDLVIELTSSAARKLPELFPESEFYLPPKEVILLEIARERRGHFNIIHFESGFKADVYLCGEDPLHLWALERRRSLSLNGEPIYVAPPEYVILRKLEYYREGASEKHIRDIKSILRVSKDEALNLAELSRWVETLGLKEEWEKARL